MSQLSQLLSRLKELHERATPGPWYSGTVQVYQTNHITRDLWNIAAPPRSTLHDNWEADRNLIAEMRSHLPLLLEVIETQREALEIWNDWGGRVADEGFLVDNLLKRYFQARRALARCEKFVKEI